MKISINFSFFDNPTIDIQMKNEIKFIQINLKTVNVINHCVKFNIFTMKKPQKNNNYKS
jgi:hypothetical protein